MGLKRYKQKVQKMSDEDLNNEYTVQRLKMKTFDKDHVPAVGLTGFVIDAVSSNPAQKVDICCKELKKRGFAV